MCCSLVRWMVIYGCGRYLVVIVKPYRVMASPRHVDLYSLMVRIILLTYTLV